MPDLSTMTAAELVERLAGFKSLSIRQVPTILAYQDTSGGYGGRVDPYSTTFQVIGIHVCNGLCSATAPTLAVALEEALRKAENNA